MMEEWEEMAIVQEFIDHLDWQPCLMSKDLRKVGLLFYLILLFSGD